MRQIKAFWGLKRKDKVMICRVSDLLNKGFDTEKIISDFIRINKSVWDDLTGSEYIWTEKMLKSQLEICPEHLYCAFEEGKMVATASGFRTTEEDMKRYKSWLEKTGNGYFTHHVPDGDIGFGADLSVLKEASKRTSDRLMLTLLFKGLIGNGLKALYLGSRIPGYHKHSELAVEEYVFGKRSSGKPFDPELYFYLKQGFEIVEIIPEYMNDPESLNYGVLIRWRNPLYGVTKMFPLLKLFARFR